MPRTKKDPSVPTFDFVINAEKGTLAKSTVSLYKSNLNLLTKLSAQRHAKDSDSPILKSKADLLAHPRLVVDLIESHTAERTKRSALFASVFYSTGRQDLTANPSAAALVTAFQKNYYRGAEQPKAEEEEIEELEEADLGEVKFE
jgi:hypothetical protein